MFNLLKEVPPFEGKTPEWLEAPPLKLISKKWASLLSFVPAILMTCFFCFIAQDFHPLDINPYVLIAASLMILPLHELAHGIGSPGFGFTSKTRYGFHPGFGPFCVHLGAISLPRYRVMALAPFVLWTCVPVALEFMGWNNDFLRVVSIVNAAMSTMDLIMVFAVPRLFPKGSMVATDGMKGLYLPPKPVLVVS